VCGGAWLRQLPWVQRRAPGQGSGDPSRALWPGDVHGAPLGVGARGQRLEARPLHSTAPECLPVDAHRGHAGPPVLSAQGANGASVLALALARNGGDWGGPLAQLLREGSRPYPLVVFREILPWFHGLWAPYPFLSTSRRPLAGHWPRLQGVLVQHCSP